MNTIRSALTRAHALALRTTARLRPLPPLSGQRPTLLITGAGGRIGRILRSGLDEEYEIRGLDVRPGPGVDLVADLRRLGRIERAFAGIESVIDLAAYSLEDTPWETVRENNLTVCVNTLEAARRAGVSRVVLASSHHVTGMYENDEPYASIVSGSVDGLDPATVQRIGVGTPIRPDGFYAVGKVAAEAAGRFYSDAYGMSVICLRIGHVNRKDRPKHPSHFSMLLTHRDLVQLVRRCLAAPPSLRFAVFYGVSANTWRFWDIDDARETIGYSPEDDAESWR